MSCSFCGMANRALAERALAEGSSVLSGMACASCHERICAMDRPIAVLRLAPIPEASDRTALIRRAVEGARRNAPSPRAWRFLTRPRAIALAGVTATLMIAVVWGGMAVRTRDPHIVAGHLATAEGGGLSVGESIARGKPYLVAEHGATVLWSDGTRIDARAGSNFVVHHDRVEIREGSVTMDVAHRTARRALSVETSEATVRVVGTRFTVSRGDQTTHVAVTEGRVELVSAVDRRELGAGSACDVTQDGSMRCSGSPFTGGAPSALQSAVASSSAGSGEPDAGSEPTASGSTRASSSATRIVRAADIRRRLHDGDVRGARELVRAASTQPSNIAPGEMAILGAEVLLAEKHYADAIDAYLKVARTYPNAPQAEEAQFEAAQLTFTHGQRDRGVLLLEKYVERYPQGRFRREAERLLQAAAPH